MSAIGHYVNRECATKHAEIPEFWQQKSCRWRKWLLKIGLDWVSRIDKKREIETKQG
jgi:hypothetical protein